MIIPEKYQWLYAVGTLPKMVNTAINYLGLKEVPGKASSPVILRMAEDMGLSKIYTDDDLSWCALFVNYLIRITGKPPVDLKGDLYNALRAKWLAKWGQPVARGDERLGDLVVLKRNGGGHVCLWIAETEKGFVGLGGNQGNSVTFAEFPKERIIAIRRYYATGLPASAKHYKINGTGQMSTDEA